MEFDRIMRTKTRASEKQSKLTRLEQLVDRSLLLEEALNGDSYKSIDLSFNGMDPDLVIKTNFTLSVSDSLDILKTLLSSTDKEIRHLQALLDL